MQKQSWSWLLWLNDSCQPDQPHCYFAGGDVVRGIRLMLSPTNGLLEGKKSPQETNKGNFINSSLTDLSQLSSLVTKMRHFVLSPQKCSSTSWERFSLELDFDIVTYPLPNLFCPFRSASKRWNIPVEKQELFITNTNYIEPATIELSYTVMSKLLLHS